MTPPARIRPVGSDEILIEAGGYRLVADAACPHRNGRLRFARINARTMKIACPLHGATFDLLTGSRVAGPDCGALRVERLDEPPLDHPVESAANSLDPDNPIK